MVSNATDERTTERAWELQGHHHSTSVQSGRGDRSLTANAHRMDRGRRRTYERTGRRNFGFLERKRQNRIATAKRHGPTPHKRPSASFTRANGDCRMTRIRTQPPTQSPLLPLLPLLPSVPNLFVCFCEGRASPAQTGIAE
jgi:hypothetical protein